ncbi:MAG: hypothetical protein HC802_18795 [Caldilineaceae bacterium]|nr:hypothetical protein [Caldilineaceae bacterium]
MYNLLAAYFENVTEEHFTRDLNEKDWVVLLSDASSGVVKGFSTLLQIRMMVGDMPIVALFSGDTIIDRAYWGEAELPRIWGAHVFELADSVAESDPGAKVYWFLISSGYKTYRFLTVFFRRYFPRYAEATPPEIKQILDALARAKFGDEYDAASGLIRFAHPSPLRDGVAEVTPQRLRDPHIHFFVESNPGYMQGDQLACLVEIARDNLTPAGRRMLE